MKKIDLHEAQANFCELVGLVQKGEEVIICKAGQPVAKLVSYKEKKTKRKPGIWKNKVKIKKNFD